MREKKRKKPDDVIRGRSFEGAEYAATEREQSEERTRPPSEDESDEFVTDAEIEARKLRARDDDE